MIELILQLNFVQGLYLVLKIELSNSAYFIAEK